MIASALIKALDGDVFDNSFKNLYPSKDISERKSRFKKLAENFLSLYGDKDVFLFPSRDVPSLRATIPTITTAAFLPPR